MPHKIIVFCVFIFLTVILTSAQADPSSCQQSIVPVDNSEQVLSSNTCIKPGKTSLLTPEANGLLTPEQSANFLGGDLLFNRQVIDIELEATPDSKVNEEKLIVNLGTALGQQEHLYIFEQGKWHYNHGLAIKSKNSCQHSQTSWQSGLIAGNKCIMLSLPATAGKMRQLTASVQQNQAPIAKPDSIEVFTGTFSYLSPLGNDFDPDGDTLILVEAEIDHGRFTINRNAGYILNYIPPNGFTGIARGTYKISDGALSAETEIVLTVLENANTTPITPPVSTNTTPGNTGSSSSGGGGTSIWSICLAAFALWVRKKKK